MKMKAVFLDKEGTLVKNAPFNVNPSRLRLTAHAAQGLRSLHESGFALIVISNQPGLAHGYINETELSVLERKIRSLLNDKAGVPLTGFYFCPHHPAGCVPSLSIECLCRKPRPGMLLRAARDHDIHLEESWFIGDIPDDMDAGRRAGCRTILLDNGDEIGWGFGSDCTPDYFADDLSHAAQIISFYETKGRANAGSSVPAKRTTRSGR